jgi:hypothetical protein
VAVQALLKNKSARPLMLSFSPHRRCADTCMLPLARLERPTLAKLSAHRRTAPGPLAGWRLCGQPGLHRHDHTRGIKRPAGVRKEDWLLALDASDLLCRRRIFNRCVCSRHARVHPCVAAMLHTYKCTWPLCDRWNVAIISVGDGSTWSPRCLASSKRAGITVCLCAVCTHGAKLSRTH